MLDSLTAFYETGLYTAVFASAGATSLLLLQHTRRHTRWWEPTRHSVSLLLAPWAGAGLSAYLMTGHPLGVLVAVGFGIALTFCARWRLRDYLLAAHVLLANVAVGLFFGLGWTVSFILSIPVSGLTRGLMLTGVAVMAAPLTVDLIALLPNNGFLLRRRWHRPRRPLPPASNGHFPFVSLHVPCYAEPPDVVIATLDALSRLRYPEYEVLVIDNNTKDPALWRPVEAHCERLGPRFRFFHVDPLAGAKAGALNFAMRQMSPRAEIVGVVDSDYQAEPDFLERLVGFFDDPRMGFVQTPHDYRPARPGWYEQMCYWEYLAPLHRLRIPSLSEWGAAIMVGTMCLIRRRALEEAGGWAEWSLTEDSECGVRVHAAGYESVFLPQTFGHGLIPETFGGYKKQRIRWTIGPIQQLRRHWRLYLPRLLGVPSGLTFWQKAMEVSRAIHVSVPVLALVGLPFALLTLGSMIHRREVVTVPTVVWVGLAIGTAVGLASTWLTYRLAGCPSVRHMVGAEVARVALGHARLVAVLKAWLAQRWLHWNRTSKFKPLPQGLGALESVIWESVLAAVLMVAGLALASRAATAPPDLLFLGSMGMSLGGVSYLAAPAMAILAEVELRRERRAAVERSAPASTSRAVAQLASCQLSLLRRPAEHHRPIQLRGPERDVFL